MDTDLNVELHRPVDFPEVRERESSLPRVE